MEAGGLQVERQRGTVREARGQGTPVQEYCLSPPRPDLDKGSGNQARGRGGVAACSKVDDELQRGRRWGSVVGWWARPGRSGCVLLAATMPRAWVSCAHTSVVTLCTPALCTAPNVLTTGWSTCGRRRGCRVNPGWWVHSAGCGDEQAPGAANSRHGVPGGRGPRAQATMRPGSVPGPVPAQWRRCWRRC